MRFREAPCLRSAISGGRGQLSTLICLTTVGVVNLTLERRNSQMQIEAGASCIATIGQKTSSDWPINGALSPPCYWVEQNKNKQSERGQRSSEVETDAEVRGPGRLTRDLGEQQRRRRRRPEGSVAAARLARSGGPRCLPQLLSLQRQPLVGGGGVGGSWRRRPSPCRACGAGVRRLLGDRQAQPRPPQRPGLRRTGPGALLLAPAGSLAARARPLLDPPPGLDGSAGLSQSRGSSPPRRPTFHFPLGVGVGRRVSGPTEIL
ncbi:unnamed protein product [Rangifer tarandus platyrhynchus]|uniref:Uncharacterized protein n=2 Tax=Rangifer tarandus platyrhynchus TaxID=3082113 RepID=A0ABN8ZX34_RANTA|nr:unnamed protein product [Rangifer tarandus platyrhynchus]CAI9711421.1 unnamed protein product [Rangifer tarandus platyrhynchus]